MPQIVEVLPTAGASTNPLGMTFGATATIEFNNIPERIRNKDIPGIELTMVDYAGVYLEKGPLKALVPWSSITVLIY